MFNFGHHHWHRVHDQQRTLPCILWYKSNTYRGPERDSLIIFAWPCTWQVYLNNEGQNVWLAGVGLHDMKTAWSLAGCEKVWLAEDGFDPSTSGLWAQHASAAPLCSLLLLWELAPAFHDFKLISYPYVVWEFMQNQADLQRGGACHNLTAFNVKSTENIE